MTEDHGDWRGRLVHALPPPGDALLVVPPFAALHRPPLGVHLLQAVAERAGQRVSVFYANLCFARLIGRTRYAALAALSSKDLLGERIFCSAAFGRPPLGYADDQAVQDLEGRLTGRGLSWEDCDAAVRGVPEWLDAVAAAIAERGYRVVGCSSMFAQNVSSLALLARVKALVPGTVTVMGGANCEGAMAEGLASIGGAVDHFFAGESDLTFPDFLSGVLAGRMPAERIIRGAPVTALDVLPAPCFTDFYAQLATFFPEREAPALWSQIRIPCESSRGCWWGEKHHCTFCGLNGLGMISREKSPQRVLDELHGLARNHPGGRPRVSMTDNIMPHRYFRTLLPRLANQTPPLKLFYEQKANLGLDNVLALKRAGIDHIQPGIESLSTPFLRRMRKGVSAAQNIALLRYAGTAELKLTWNLLHDFPGESREDLRVTLALLPLIAHLQPPSLSRLSVVRFSPYFDRPEAYGISGMRPLSAYAEIYPPHAEIEALAWSFRADYDAASRTYPDLVAALADAVAVWRRAWHVPERAPPLLHVHGRPDGRAFVLIDTRSLPGTAPLTEINRARASLALVDRALQSDDDLDWALARKVGALHEGRYLALATAAPEVLAAFEAERRPGQGAPPRRPALKSRAARSGAAPAAPPESPAHEPG